MESHGEQTHYVKRVVLPSGKTIEVVYFRESDEPAASRQDLAPESANEVEHPPAEADQELHVCMECASELVYPVAWEEAGHTRWSVSVRCPNCEWHCTEVFDDEVVMRFDEALDRGTDAVVADLRRLAHANMQEDVERFVRALDDGHVLPEDF